MDWTKAKSMLIVALIITNIVLIGTYYFQNNRLLNNEKQMETATIKLLEEQNIYLNTDMPKKHPEMAKLTVQYDSIDKSLVDAQIAKQEVLLKPNMTDDKLAKLTESFLGRCGMMTDNVVLEKIKRSDDNITLTYKNYIDDIAIEDSYIIITVKGGKITKVDRFWLNPVEVSKNEKELITAAAALIKFMSENNADEKIYVDDIQLVYWLDASSFDAESPVTDTAFPAWKITYNKDKIKHIPAWEQ